MKELVFPSCPKCRAMRVAMCVAALVVIGTYLYILISMDEAARPREEA